MRRADLVAFLCCAGLAAACPHDFTRDEPDVAVVDAAVVDQGQVDQSVPDMRDWRAPDVLPHPDAGCPLPCVTTLPHLFGHPTDVALQGGKLYVVDKATDQIWVIEAGKATVLAGDGTEGAKNGAASSAQFFDPTGVVADGTGTIYVADSNNHRIRAIANGQVTTFAGSSVGVADGPVSTAQFYWPNGVAVAGDKMYVTDSWNNRIRQIENAKVSTLAGGAAGVVDGPVGSALFYNPEGVVVDGLGKIYVADCSNHRIRLIDNGQVSTLAGSSAGYLDGPANLARFYDPKGIAVDSAGTVYVADYSNHRIRVVAEIQGEWTVKTLAGSGVGFANGPALSAQFSHPKGLAVDSAGKVYVADSVNSRIRVIEQP